MKNALTLCFDTKKERFEHTVKSTSKYQNLIFIHGERLFIMENNQYKIAAVQLAWEIYQEQQKQIDELDYQNALYTSERGALITKCNVMKKDWQKIKDEKLKQQHQIDALQVLIQKWRDNPYLYADLNVWECIARLEQAIRGEA